MPDTIKIAEGGFNYSDEEEDGFDAAAMGEDDEEEEKKQAVNVNDI